MHAHSLLLSPLLLLAACQGPTGTPAPPPAPAPYTWLSPEGLPALREVRELVEAAASRGDVPLLRAARARLEELAARGTGGIDGSLAPQALYSAGYVGSVLASRLEVPDEVRRCVEHGLAALERALELEPEHADAHAMLGMLLLQKADVSGLSALSLARRARRSMERALELEPDNPRVVMLDGVRLYNLPGLLGGSQRRGRARFREALALWAEAPGDDPRRPTWGEADAHVWAGLAALEAGERAEARRLLEAALALRPGYVWVEEELLPLLEE